MKKLVLGILAAGTALAAAAPANAAIFIGVSVNGGAITQVASSTSGSANYNTTDANGIFYNVSATGAPLLPVGTLLTQSVNIAGTNGTVDLYITQTDVAGITGIASSFTSNTLQGVNAVIRSYYDANNGVFTGTLLQSATFSGPGTFMGGNVISSRIGSETVRYTLNFTGGAGSNFNGTANLTAVPEPATWGLMMLGFGAMGFALRRRRNVETRIRFA
ncbi:PEPxxWA-CTERM sorting domain-containing protein [Sphingomonas sp. RS2018]